MSDLVQIKVLWDLSDEEEDKYEHDAYPPELVEIPLDLRNALAHPHDEWSIEDVDIITEWLSDTFGFLVKDWDLV